MEWAQTAEGQQDGKRSGCVMLRELPSRPTQRVCKLSTDLQLSSEGLDLQVFQGSTYQQQKQLEAFQAAWQDINSTIKDLRQHTLAPVFNQLQQWAAAHGPVQPSQHQAPSSSSSSSTPNGSALPGSASAAGALPCGSHQLPMVALSITSSTNAAATYAELLYTLKCKGHPVALVPARGAASGLSHTINAAMRSFLNEPTAADDVPALLAWWQDTCQQHSSKTGLASAAIAAHTPGTTHKVSAAANGVGMDVDAATPQRTMARTAAAATPARELRARTPAKTPGRTGGEKSSSSSGVKQLGPPVTVLQDADSGDVEALEELVVAMSEARVSGVPVVLVLGISITPSHLLQLLPNGLLRRAQLTTLALPPARVQVAQLYRSLLLRGPQPPLILGPRISDWLLQHFRDVDCSAAMAERVLQLACTQHYGQQQLSCLAAAAATGSRKAVARSVKQLSQDQLMDCCRALLSQPAAAAAAAAMANSSSQSPARTTDAGHVADAALAVRKLQEFVSKGTSSSSSSSREKYAGAAAQVLSESVCGAMQSYGKWRLGVMMLDMLARFTGVADMDASLQVPAIYTAASQPDFLTIRKKGNLSTCGKLLLKLLGTSSSSSSSGRGRAGVTVVHALSDAECLELLGKLVELVADVQLTQKQRNKQQKQQLKGTVADPAAGEVNADSSSSSSSDTESDGDEEGSSDASSADDAIAGCTTVQQLQQLLLQLQAAAGAAAAAAAAANLPEAAAVVSAATPSKRRKHQQQQQSDNQGQLSTISEQFSQLLAPLQDILESAAATPVTAAAAANGGSLISTPATKGQCAAAAGSSQDTITPGGLASLLRKHVRFAPDTPDHANGKHAGSSSSARSTPEELAAAPVPGLIKTPNKKGLGATQPKRLFAAAAANAAAAAAAKQPKRKKGEKKQAIEEGDIAGSSAAVLAAAAGLAQSPAATAAVAGNKRTQRLMQMMTASGPSAATAAAGSNKTTAAAAGSSAAPAARKGIRTRGLLSTPPALDPAAAAGSPDEVLLSPRAGRSRSSRSATPAAAEDVPADAAAGMLMSPVVAKAAAATGTGAAPRGGSRLSRQSEPALQQQQQDLEDADYDELTPAETAAAAVGSDAPRQQQQQQESEQAATVTCSSLLASLLEAVVPKLLLDWSCPAAASSSSSPLAAAAAAAFVYDDLDSVSSMLSPAPPCTVHAALTNPSQKLKGHPQALQDGWEDTCLAYVLLQQQREESLAVTDWFGLFCQAQGLQGFRGSEGGLVGYNDDSDLNDEEGDAAPSGRAARSKARAGRKARGYAEARETAAAARSSSSKSTAKKDQATPKSTGKRRAAAAAAGSGKDEQNDAEAAEVDEQELLVAAARFCQAAAELEVLGVWKAAKKRRMAAVHRVFAPEGQLAAGTGYADVELLADHDYE